MNIKETLETAKDWWRTLPTSDKIYLLKDPISFEVISDNELLLLHQKQKNDEQLIAFAKWYKQFLHNHPSKTENFTFEELLIKFKNEKK